MAGCNTTPEVSMLPPNQDFRVWPNPANQIVMIYVNNTGAVGDLKIIDNESRVIYNAPIPTGENRFEVDLQSAPEGFCYALATVGQGDLSLKFIKLQ